MEDVNAVITSFDPKEKQSVEKAMKRMRVESDQLRKLKISCTRPVKEWQKFVSKLCIGMNKTECAWQAWKSHETVINSSQHTSTITCTDAPRVWHYSAFHSAGNNISESKLYDQDQRTDIGTKFTTRTNVLKLGLELETNNRFETFFKDNGGNSGRAVKFTRLKNKTLKALTIRRDILPKELLTRIDKCKFKHGNLKLITVVHTVIYTSALSLWGGGGGGVYMYTWKIGNSNSLVWGSLI